MLHTEHVRSGIESKLATFLVWYTLFAERVAWMVDAVEASLPVDLSSETDLITGAMRGHYGRAAQVQTVIAGVVIGAALLIGFFVVSQIDDALPAISDADLSTDKNSTLDRIGDGLLIGGVVIIVLFAAVILRVLRGL